jgi:hypothetical protein
MRFIKQVTEVHNLESFITTQIFRGRKSINQCYHLRIWHALISWISDVTGTHSYGQHTTLCIIFPSGRKSKSGVVSELVTFAKFFVSDAAYLVPQWSSCSAIPLWYKLSLYKQATGHRAGGRKTEMSLCIFFPSYYSKLKHIISILLNYRFVCVPTATVIRLLRGLRIVRWLWTVKQELQGTKESCLF